MTACAKCGATDEPPTPGADPVVEWTFQWDGKVWKLIGYYCHNCGNHWEI